MSAYSITGFRLALLLRNKVFINNERRLLFVIKSGGYNGQYDKEHIKSYVVPPGHVFENATAGTRKGWVKSDHVNQVDSKDY